jgi:hypothetical protein
MTADDTRLAIADVLAETRDLMERSANQTRRSFNRKAALARLTRLAEETPTQPARLALPAPAPVPKTPTFVDLSGVDPITERDLSIGTGVSLRSIAKAITSKKIRVTKVKGRPRLLDITSTARWLQAEHHVAPTMLIDIHREEEN